MERKRLRTLAAGVAVVIVVALIGFVLHSFTAGASKAGGTTTVGVSDTAKQQLFDQQGGMRVEATASCPQTAPNCDMDKALSSTVSALNRRLADAGIANALVRQNGAAGLVIEAPGQADDAQLRALLVPGEVTFLDTGPVGVNVGTDVSGHLCTSACQPGEYPIIFTGAQVDPATVQATTDRQTGQATVTFAFSGDARTRFATYTQQHIGEYLTIALDGKIVEAAIIQSAITGSGEISGVGTLKQAQNLARFLKDGALPVTLTLGNVEHVAAVK